MKKLLLLCSILIMPLFAEKYECIKLYNDYKIDIRGTRDVATRVSTRNYTSKSYCKATLEYYLSRH